MEVSLTASQRMNEANPAQPHLADRALRERDGGGHEINKERILLREERRFSLHSGDGRGWPEEHPEKCLGLFRGGQVVGRPGPFR
jgi:hypothetical protein